jgi:hypothetical protein
VDLVLGEFDRAGCLERTLDEKALKLRGHGWRG